MLWTGCSLSLELYLDALSSQADIVEAELLHPSELLLLAQAQCGIEDVHLAVCLARRFMLKCWRYTKGFTASHMSSTCEASPLIVTAPGKSSRPHPASAIPCTIVWMAGWQNLRDSLGACRRQGADQQRAVCPLTCKAAATNAVHDAARPLQQRLHSADPFAMIPGSALAAQLLLHGACVAGREVVPSVTIPNTSSGHPCALPFSYGDLCTLRCWVMLGATEHKHAALIIYHQSMLTRKL